MRLRGSEKMNLVWSTAALTNKARFCPYLHTFPVKLIEKQA